MVGDLFSLETHSTHRLYLPISMSAGSADRGTPSFRLRAVQYLAWDSFIASIARHSTSVLHPRKISSSRYLVLITHSDIQRVRCLIPFQNSYWSEVSGGFCIAGA